MWNHAPQQQQLVGPPPHGKTIGIMKCVFKESKNVLPNSVVPQLVIFNGGNLGFINLSLSAEDAEYFTLGQSYAVSFTQP